MFLSLVGFVGCGGAVVPQSKVELEECSDVLISVANQDLSSPTAMMKVSLDGRPLVYGPVRSSEEGEYFYFSTRVAESQVRVRVVSEVDGKLVEAEKSVMVRNNLWLVATRAQDLDGVSAVTIEVSYEAPAFAERPSGPVIQGGEDGLVDEVEEDEP